MTNNSFPSRQHRPRLFPIYLLVVTTLMGALIYIGFASLYHVVIIALLLVVFYRGFLLRHNKTAILGFFIFWVFEAFFSVLWAPDQELALMYSYYIFLLIAMCLIFHAYINQQNLSYYINFMVILLFVCNLIAIWEVVTGNHIARNYLSSPIRIRLLKYLPGTFFRNPNDFATFVIQILPFSLVMASVKKKYISTIATFNLAASFFSVCAAQSRTQIILIIILYACYIIIERKTKLLKTAALLFAGVCILYLVYPEFKVLVNNALKSVTRDAIVASATEGGSVSTRIALMRNGIQMLLDTYLMGVGAGCHRTLMLDYGAMYYPTGHIVVMHNLLAELFVDYGVVVGITFLVALVSSIKKLIFIFKSSIDPQIRTLAFSLALVLGSFIFCSMSSSSIIQLSSVWITICFISSFIRLYTID